MHERGVYVERSQHDTDETPDSAAAVSNDESQHQPLVDDFEFDRERLSDFLTMTHRT